MTTIWLYAIALGGGLSFVFQQAVNSNLRTEIGSSWWAGFVSYAGGTLAMLLMAILMNESSPTIEAIQRSNWLSWMGGIFGAVYIAISILLLPRLGVTTVIALIITGQMIASLAFDHFGLLSAPVHHLSFTRAAGALLLVAGVVLIRS
jgi:bacterial/archaeal transporter family-2 protein